MAALLSGWLRDRRYNVIIPYLHGDILDVGCHDGRLAGLLQHGQSYVGIELRRERVEWLRARWPGREFHCRDIDNRDLELNRRFDTIVMTAVIEHLHDSDRVLRQMPDYLDAGGRLVITTPSPLGNRIHALGARLGLFHAGAAREHTFIYDRNDMSACLARNGLMIAEYRQFLMGGNQLFICMASGHNGGAG